MNDLEKRARTTFWQALVGVCTCCGPLGVFALLKALGVKREAERASERVPRFAYIAIALGALSCIEFAAAVVAGYQAQQKRDATVERAQSRMSGKRGAAVLQQDVACDLATEYLLKIGGRYDAVSCPGHMERVGDSVLFSGIVATSTGQNTKL